jgi:mono/diheme cytochrome c family protein
MKAAAALLVALGCTSVDIDPMEQQQKYKAYQETPFFDDGRVMRQPPEGTVPRERVLGQPAFEAGSDEAGHPLDRLPIPITEGLLAKGRHRFEITCAACHGLLGDGNSLVARNMSLRPPPSLYPYIRSLPPGRIFQIITSGWGLMPPYAEHVPSHERWAVIAYLRALERSQNATLADLPPDERRKLEARP